MQFLWKETKCFQPQDRNNTNTTYRDVSPCCFQRHLTEINLAAKHGSSERQTKLLRIVSIQPVDKQAETGFKTRKPALAQDYAGDIFHCESIFCLVLRGTYLDFGCSQ